ncbi:cobalt-precorrin 5A hydrolase [Sporomusa acidovorans]|uniref:Cobalt-precorrin-5A hydrolase n=1 Tax=Sporomusa acidovorans (strain ATCC 49682 / DSM 3132 / Mol) TaxID=1123286 RepID=A0ABZ3J1T5_SPOA4|nr:cobalt-precorrin 5A hydrolase [Sporomusa acidovorans]OZC15052.1 cobalamin biosynthesis protein CbiG [Sporomusa acidovorans DSM 3132]SDE84698.1 cobalt-precorrin 5A acetaldehyde-lyase [Sporomusa acidovorans]
MKLAVISVTNKGAELAGKIAPLLEAKVDIYVKNGRNPQSEPNTYNCLSDLVHEIFSVYDGLIFIMATGIVVRVIAPYVKDKRFDPAVVVMDDGGTFAISLLSGHIGGANELAQLVGNAVQATPVITTATDVAKLPAADVLAVKLNLAMEPFASLKTINSVIVNGGKVAFLVDKELDGYAQYICSAAELNVPLADTSELAFSENYDAAVIITDRNFPIAKPHLYLRPGSLAVGVGCRRGTSGAEILSAISQACQAIGRSIKSVAIIGSTTVKEDEIGLLSAAQQLAVPIEFYTHQQLNECIEKHALALSNFVNEKIGVGNVCEPAAILAGRTSKLFLPKTKYPKVTVAITPVRYR